MKTRTMLNNGVAAALCIFLSGVLAQASDVITVTTKNSIIFREEVSETSVASLMKEVVRVNSESPKGPIYLFLDTPGGSVDAGEDLIQFLKQYPRIKTVTIFAASMGSAIVQASSNERLIVKNGIMMFHRARGGFRGQFETGEVESRLKVAKNVIYTMEQRNAKRMGLSTHDYKNIVKDELWMDALESIGRNAADRVVEIKCTKQALEKKTLKTVTVDTMFGPTSLEILESSCPLLRYPDITGVTQKADFDMYIKTFFSRLSLGLKYAK